MTNEPEDKIPPGEFTVLDVNQVDANGNFFGLEAVREAFKKNHEMPLPVLLDYDGPPVGAACLTRIEDGLVWARLTTVSPSLSVVLKTNPGAYCAGLGLSAENVEFPRVGVSDCSGLTFHSIGIFPADRVAYGRAVRVP